MVTAGWILIFAAGLTGVIAGLVTGGPEGAGVAAAVVAGACLGYFLLLGQLKKLRAIVLAHLRTSQHKATVMTEAVPPSFRIDLLRALAHFRDATAPHLPVLGAPGTPLLSYIESDFGQSVQPLAWENLAAAPDGKLHLVTNGLFRLFLGGKPVVAKTGVSNGSTLLEVMAADAATAQRACHELLAWARANSIYRGQVISFDEDIEMYEGPQVWFVDLAPVPRERIVLPEDVMAVVDRNVGGLLKHAGLLRRAGRSTRHGVLFHGPPGTGKSLVTRYLARSCPDYTAIVLNGRSMRFVRESFRLAKLLAPAMLILEDVDLIALDRKDTAHNTLLHDLLDEMDGLGRKTDCIILLTTNRPDYLEPALASRPGRVDQAILFPLPDLDCRRRLFALFADQLDLAQVDVEALLERTDGASPAFLEELFRKAALLAIERGEHDVPLGLTTADFDLALHELLHFGGDLTRNLLGFRARAGFHAVAAGAHDGNGQR